jgi:polar amino acid transport system permease protein
MGNLNLDLAFFVKYLFDPPAILLWGLWLTIAISVVAQTLGVIVGLFVALARMSRHGWLRFVAKFYIWLWRGTPLLVQLVIVYTGFAAAGFYRYPDLSIGPLTISGPLQAAIVVLSLNEAAYMAEIFRAAISSIDRGQLDAAKALGMSPAISMRRIILPQALRIVIPPLGNEFTLMLKGTSLLSVIGIRELFGTLQSINAATFRTFELFAIAAIWYLILTSVMGVVQNWLEARFGRQDPKETLGRLERRTLISGQR